MSEVSADDRDLAIRTMLGEEGSDAGQAGVAAVILNRLAAGSYGGSVGDVVLAPNQFEAWTRQSDQLLGVRRDDPRYVAAGQLFDAVRDGSLPDPTNGATHFYAPVAQAALGRQAPGWAQGRGLKLGSSMFYAPQGRVERKPEEPGFKVDPSKIADKSPSQTAAKFPSDQLPPGATLFQPSSSKAVLKAAEFPSDQLPPGATLFKPDAQKPTPGFVEKGIGALERVATDPDPLSREKVGEQIDAVYGAGRENVEQGIARMKSGNIAGGAFQDVAGTLQEVASVPTGWGMALLGLGQYGDPMMAGTEAPHIASAGDAAKYARTGAEGRAAVEAPAPGAASPTLRPSAGEVPPAPPPSPPRAGIEPREFPRDQLPPGAEPVKPPAEVRPAPRLVLRETLPPAEFGGTVLPESHNFSIVDEKGDTIGDVAISPRKETKTLVVDWVGDPEGKEQLNLGPAAARGMLRQLAEQYPEYDWVQGFRTGGARTKSGEGSTWAPRIRLRPESGEPREFPRDQLPPGAEPVKLPAEVRPGAHGAGGETPVTIQFRGKIYSGATKLDAVQAAHAANPDVGLEHISNAVTPETTAAGVDAHYAARRAQAAPGGVGAAATPPSALLPPAALEPKISVTQPVRNFAHAIRAIFDAPGVSGKAKAAAGLIRESRGLSKRAAEQARTTLEPFMRQVRKLSIDDRLKLIDYIETRTEGGTAWFMKDPTLQPVADALRDVFWRVRNTLEDMPSEARMGFIEDYFPHQWVDPKKAGEFVRQWVARMGEGGFTKKRSIPTLVDGIRAGLVPRTVDPIEAALLYIENAYQFIAHNRTFNEAKDAGFIKLATPGDQPDGWVRLNGRLADRGFVKAWAPEDFARVYNNALSTLAGPAGDVINGLRRAFNVITGIELAWPGFHMSAMAMESIANKIASALSDATRWRLDQTAIKLATSPAAPVTMLRRGAEAQRIYRSLTDGSAEMREIIDLLTRADFRFVGKGRAADEYRFSGADNYFKAIRRGTLLTELNADLKRAGRQPIVGTAAGVLKNIGRAMETMTAPLFEYAIPKLKSGAAVELMANWLRAHPDATAEAKLAHAREVANVIDDRFGEMNQDSLFWHANLRAGAQMALLSFSWEMGFLRTVVGGTIDWAKFPFTHRQTERMGYLIALPLAIAAVNGASTYLHTGEAPSGMDFVTPRTGGKNPDGSPERASIPSWARNVLAWANVLSGPKRGALADELYGMANPGVKDAIDFARNSDWHGDPIFSSAPDAPPWLKQILQHIVEQHIPMPLQLGSQPKPGTGITGLESLLGVRPAPFFMQEPDLYQSIYDKKNVKEWKAAQKFRERQRVLHGQ